MEGSFELSKTVCQRSGRRKEAIDLTSTVSQRMFLLEGNNRSCEGPLRLLLMASGPVTKMFYVVLKYIWWGNLRYLCMQAGTLGTTHWEWNLYHGRYMCMQIGTLGTNHWDWDLYHGRYLCMQAGTLVTNHWDWDLYHGQVLVYVGRYLSY